MNSLDQFKQIISDGYCIGCGACAYMVPDRIRMQFDRYGMIQPEVDNGLEESKAADILQVCPFADGGSNEDDIGRQEFSSQCNCDERIGYHKDLYIGHVAEGNFRERGTSGGVVTWILTDLLQQGEIDAVIHVKKTEEPADGILFRYGISRTADEIMAGAKSRYYPIEISGALEQIRQCSGRYAVVGVPCFIKAVRRLALHDPVIQERVVFCIGLVCGHLKSKAFADSFGWQAGILPGQLEEIDFRVKRPGRQASEYGVTVRGAGIEKTAPAASYFGANWGYGFFKYSACEYCDDVFAETADVSVGDAWLSEFTADSRGNSVVITRSGEMERLFRAARKEGRLNLQDCPAEKMAESQAGGLRHRRDGLACRLLIKKEQNEWVPQKRVAAYVQGISSRRRKIYLLREVLRTQSHDLWLESVRAGDFAAFRIGMQKLIRRYNRLYVPFHARLLQRVKQMMKKSVAVNRLRSRTSASQV